MSGYYYGMGSGHRTHQVAAAAATTGAAAYATAVLADSPRGYWKCNDGSGSSLADSSGNALTLSLFNTPSLAGSGPMTGETCVAFVAASSQYASHIDDALLDLGNVWSMECWIKLTSAGVACTLMGKDKATAYEMQLFSNQAYSTGGGSNLCNTSSSFSDTSTWHHIVATKNGATNKIYLDGADVTVAGTNATSTDNATEFAIGRKAGASNSYVNASMAHVAVYPTALSSARVTAHYNARG